MTRRPGTSVVVRVALRLVPAAWRDAVASDLAEEAARHRRGRAWVVWQAALAALRLRPAMFVDGMRADLRHVWRAWRRTPWMAAAAIATFALGIGVNVAMFAAVDRMLFRSLPYQDSDSLVMLQLCASGGCGGAFPKDLAYRLRSSRTVADVATAGFSGPFGRSADDQSPVRLMEVSPNLLRVLGVAPLLGRGVTDAEVDGDGAYAWLAYDVWRTKFGADPQIVGRRLWSANGGAVILGVLPRRFIPPVLFGSPATWDGLVTARRGWSSISADGGGSVAAPIARLKPGVSIDEARAEAGALMTSLHPSMREQVEVQPAERWLFRRYRQQLWIVAMPSLLILALACVNLAALLLLRSRAAARTAAVQVALGASPGRIVKIALLESALVCVAGGAMGLATMGAAYRWLVAYVPALFVRNAESFVSPRILAVAGGTAVVAALLAGVLPAWRLTRTDVRVLLSESSRQGSRGRGGQWLLAAETAIGCLLVLGALFTARSLVALMTEDLGLRTDGLYAVWATPDQLPRSVPEDYQDSLTRTVASALTAWPGVHAVTRAEVVPFSPEAPPRSFSGDLRRSGRYQMEASAFDVLGMRVLAGRTFTVDEATAHAPVVVLSESAAHMLWPGTPIADVVGWEWQPAGESSRTVIGVVHDIKTSYGGGEQPTIAAFVPMGSEKRTFAKVIVRTSAGPPDTKALATRLAEDLGPVRVSITTPSADADASLTEPRFRGGLFVIMGGVALLLLCAGLYAAAGAQVDERRFDTGVRLALGASRASVSRGVIAHVLIPVCLGATVGLAGAYLAAHLADAFLYQVSSHDPGSYAAVAAVMVILTAAGAWWPARRAGRTNPLDVLRAL